MSDPGLEANQDLLRYLTLECTPRFRLNDMKALKVSEVASRACVSGDTIRFYEKEGLLPSPPRSRSGYRNYDESAVERVEFIRSGQALGLRLADIKELLEIKDHGRCPCGHTTRLVTRRIHEVEQEIEHLVQLKQNLMKMKRSAKDGRYEWCCPEGGKE